MNDIDILQQLLYMQMGVTVITKSSAWRKINELKNTHIKYDQKRGENAFIFLCNTTIDHL